MDSGGREKGEVMICSKDKNTFVSLKDIVNVTNTFSFLFLYFSWVADYAKLSLWVP